MTNEIKYQAQDSQKTLDLQDNLPILKPADFKVLNFHLRRSHLPSMYYSRKTIAKAAKCCEKTVDRANKALEELGFITIIKSETMYISNEYFLTDALKAIKGFVHRYLFQMLWGLSLSMLSSAAPAANVPLYKDKEYATVQNDAHNRIISQSVFLQSSSPYEGWPPTEHEPTKNIDFDKLDLIFTSGSESTDYKASLALREPKTLLAWLLREINEEETVMQNFSQDQLEQIAAYPNEAIKAANKALTRELLAGRNISNQFSYFLGVCKSETDKLRNPQTGNAKPQGSVASRPTVEWEAPLLVQETPFEWCMKVEPFLHKYTLEGHPGLRITKPYADAKWLQLTPEEQALLIDLYHHDCTCRSITPIPHVDNNPPHCILETEPLYKKIEHGDNSTFPFLMGQSIPFNQEEHKALPPVPIIDEPWQTDFEEQLMSGDFEEVLV